MTWGPILFVGFEGGEFITAELAVPQRYSRKQAFGRAIHTQSTDTGGTVTVRLQADSPTIALLSAQLKADLAPGGEREEGTIRVKDINATMAFSLLTGIEPNESESLPNVEFFYEVTEYTPAGEGITRRFTPGKPPEYTAAPPGWSVTLVRSYDDPDADHNSRE
jgi:hypothetical protein